MWKAYNTICSAALASVERRVIEENDMIPKEEAVENLVTEIAHKIFCYALDQKPDIGFESIDLLYALGIAFANMAEAYCEGWDDAHAVINECLFALENGLVTAQPTDA